MPACKPSSLRKNRFAIEHLEHRRLMAGDITANLVNGNLVLKEATGQAGLDNAVVVSQLPNGKILVKGGTTADGTKSLINGQTEMEFTVPGSLTANFGAGKDKVEFSILSEPITLENITLNLGVASAVGDADRDTVSITNLALRSSLVVTTGASNDSLTIAGSTIGDGAGLDQFKINMGAGADFANIKGETHVDGFLDVQMFAQAGENDVDTVYLNQNTWVEGSANIRTGAGDDSIIVGNQTVLELALQVNGSTFIDTGLGNDTVAITSAYLGDTPSSLLQIRTGKGADTVTIDNQFNNNQPVSLKNVDIQTYASLSENDADVIKMENAYIYGDLSVRMGGGDDQFFITDPADTSTKFGISIMGTVSIDMGFGNDQVHVEGTPIGDGIGEANLVIRTGAGADTVVVDFSTIFYANGASYIPEITGNVDIQTYESLGELDADVVKVPTAQVHEDLKIKLGGGNDIFELAVGNVGQDFELDAGDGHDTATMSLFVYDDLMARMGEGNDTLTLNNIWGDAISLLGEGGSDNLRKLGQVLQANQKIETGWEFLNGWPMWQQDLVIRPEDRAPVARF